MDIETLRAYCLAKLGATESFPFDAETLVFKVANKIFALLSLNDTPARVNLKCAPERAIELRETYDAVQPGYHMNKRHWNTIILDGTIPANEVREMIDDSYDLIVKSLRKVDRESLRES